MRLERVSWWAAAFVLVLPGFTYGVESALDRWRNAETSTPAGLGPLISAGFLLSGAALMITLVGPASANSRRLARVTSVLVALIGLLILSCGGSESSESFLTRMAVNSAVNFALAAAALWLMNGEGRWRQGPAQLFAIGSALVSMFALVAIAYRLSEQTAVANLIRMSFPTALGFGALSIGLLFARPDRGLMAIITSTGPGGSLARRLLLPCLFVPVALGWLLLLGEFSGLYGRTAVVTLIVVANSVFVVGLIWVNAGLIDRMEVERRATDDALRESEVFYHALVETLPQHILRKDTEGRFTFANRRFCDEVGLELKEVVGRTDRDFFPPALAEKYRADDQRVMASNEPFEDVEEHITPAGEQRYVQIVKIPLRDHLGGVIGVQGIFWDITDRRRYEDKLREQNEQLQALAESERRALEELKSTQSRMVQAAKLAGLGEMVAGVAHEINNPLSFVSNNVAVLRRDLDEVRALIQLYEKFQDSVAAFNGEALQSIREYREQTDMDYTLSNLDGLLDRTRDGLRRIQKIVGDLRVFARLDEGDLDEFDLNGGIETTVGIVLGNAKRKSVRLELDLAPLPPVTCFGTKINQVVMNLASNAIDACHEGGVVRIRTRLQDSFVRIEVEDTGCGIPPEVRERIFDPFFTTKPVGVGTGLGLSISYGIVQDHGGTIEVRSEAGQGSTFTILLPTKLPIGNQRPYARAVAVKRDVASSRSETATETIP